MTLLRALGLTPQAAAPAEDQLTAALRPARLLLVADNMEHLVEQAPLLGRLLAAAPGLRLLVTSRVPLGLYGEHQIRVPPLRLPGHGRPGRRQRGGTVVRRARPGRGQPGSTRRARTLEATASDLRCPGRAAAGHRAGRGPGPAVPAAGAAAPAAGAAALLIGGPRDVPQRQQTLRATLDWSDALLTAAARDLFARLGVFAGSFDAAAAAAVAEPGRSAGMIERLAALAEHSLAEVFARPARGSGCWQTVREYALARLAETGQADAVHERHLRHYLALATQARAHLDGPQQGDWLDRLAADFANIRAALDWAGPGRGRRPLPGRRAAPGHRGGGPFWRRRGSLAEGALHLDRLLALEARHHTAAPATGAWAVLEASALAWFSGDYPAATGLARQGLELCAALGDLLGQAWAHHWLGEAAMGLGDLATAETHFRSQLDLAGQARDRWTEAQARNMLAQISRYQGRYDEATAQLRRAQQVFQAAGDPDGAATVIGSLGEVARDAGKPDQARDLFRQALRATSKPAARGAWPTPWKGWPPWPP